MSSDLVACLDVINLVSILIIFPIVLSGFKANRSRLTPVKDCLVSDENEQPYKDN